LKALRVSAEAAVLAKDAKYNVDHNCLCQSILTIWQKAKPFTILDQETMPLIKLIH